MLKNRPSIIGKNEQGIGKLKIFQKCTSHYPPKSRITEMK